MKQGYCGLDFGTSNSTLGIYEKGNPLLVPLTASSSVLRSAIFFDSEHNRLVYGQEGVDDYFNEGQGRLMLSLKSILGSGLMEEKTVVLGKRVTYKDILGKLLQHMKTKAQNYLGHEITQVVLGRPVHFSDFNPSKDQLAQNTLEAIAKAEGFKDINFQYEPVAAALSYEQNLQKEEIVCIIDLGGGTSDFTLLKVGNSQLKHHRDEDILANNGVHIGGTDFDKALSLQFIMPGLGMGSLMAGSSSQIEVPKSIYHDLTSWHMLNFIYTPKAIAHIKQILSVAEDKKRIGRLIHVLENKQGHEIMQNAEASKINLSDALHTQINLTNIDVDFLIELSRKEFDQSVEKLVLDINDTIINTLSMAKIKADQVATVFLTGGTTLIPAVQEKLRSIFSKSEFIQGDIFGSVGKGLTIEANRLYA